MTVKKIIAILSAAILTLTFCGCSKRQSEFDSDTDSGYGTHHAVITIKDYGDIKLVLDGDTAPITVKNFVELAKSGFYDGLTFHRIIKGFMIQGGDPKGNGTGGSDKTIRGEFSKNGVENNISHKRGVISMARLQDNNSASSQFFIMHKDAPHLDGGYAAFGKVIAGMDTVDKIAAVPTDSNDRPKQEQRMQSVRFVEVT